jgi:hypothetical protein
MAPNGWNDIRQLSLDERVPDLRTVGTLLLIREGSCFFTTSTRAGRDECIREWRANGGQLVWIWPGQWKSDAFQITEDVLNSCYGVK